MLVFSFVVLFSSVHKTEYEVIPTMLLVGNELKITFFVHEAKRLTTHTWIMKKLYYAEFSLKVGCGKVWFCRHALELTPTGEAGEMRHCSSTFYSKRLKQIYFVAVKLHR